MSRHQIEVLINLVLSAMIGLIVGVFDVLLPIFNGEMAAVLFRDALIGMAVGTTVRAGCHYIIARNIHAKKYIYGYVFLTIAVLSSIPSILFGVYKGELPHLSEAIILLTVAEALGISLTYASIRYYNQLNSKLILKKKEIQSEH